MRSARTDAPRRMDRSEGERRAAPRPGDQPETEGSRREERVQSERDNEKQAAAHHEQAQRDNAARKAVVCRVTIYFNYNEL